MIEKQIVGHSVGVEFGRWTFIAKGPQEITILTSRYVEDTAQLEIKMKISGKVWSRSTEVSGRLRLHFKWIEKQWKLLYIENLTFKRK